MNFKTINDLNSAIYKNIYKIPQDVDLVVGIPVSGMLVANILALFLNLPLTDFDSMLNKRIMSGGRCKKKDKWITCVDEARKILVVEDSSSTGKSIIDAKEKLENFQYADKVMFLTAFVTKETKSLTDLYLEICEVPRIFEWNYLHHPRLDLACFDIDGVLCENPTYEQNDDGENYKIFIRNASVRVVPTAKIGYLITSRLEKYREDTEYWLKKNGIMYDNLIMMQYSTKEERLKNGKHGSFKGDKYKCLKKCFLFVESDNNQAQQIAKISGKVVFCTENQKVYEETYFLKTQEELKRKLKNKIPQKLKKFIRKMKN